MKINSLNAFVKHALCLILCICGTFAISRSTQSSDDLFIEIGGIRTVSIKGLHVGMPIKDFIRVFNSHFPNEKVKAVATNPESTLYTINEMVCWAVYGGLGDLNKLYSSYNLGGSECDFLVKEDERGLVEWFILSEDHISELLGIDSSIDSGRLRQLQEVFECSDYEFDNSLNSYEPQYGFKLVAERYILDLRNGCTISYYGEQSVSIGSDFDSQLFGSTVFGSYIAQGKVCNRGGIIVAHPKILKLDEDILRENYGKEEAVVDFSEIYLESYDAETFSQIVEAAEEGNPDAQFLLGDAYLHGKNVSEDVDKGIMWLQKAIDQDNISATILLACFYEIGEKVPKDIDKARSLYLKVVELDSPDDESYTNLALERLEVLDSKPNEHEDLIVLANQGDSKAQLTLGFKYLKGEDIAQDLSEAEKWLRLAADNGEETAMLMLAMEYFDGEQFDKNPTDAIKYSYMLAENGDPRGYVLIAMHYLKDEPNEEDMKKGIEVLQKAVDLGDPDAMVYLATLYEVGKGVPRDIERAKKIYREIANLIDDEHENAIEIARERLEELDSASPEYETAINRANQGEPAAQMVLGYMYLTGDGVAKDITEAEKWYRLAANNGNETALIKLALEYDDGVFGNDPGEAAKWARKGAELGFSQCQTILALFYWSGNGVSKDLVEAAKWARKAAEQDDPQAQYMLGVFYLTGEGVPEDSDEGIKWLTKAAEQGHVEAKEILEKIAE